MSMPEERAYFHDFTYYYYAEGRLKSVESLSQVPGEIEDFATLHDAISQFTAKGCRGDLHQIRSEYDRLCLEVLKIGVEKYGEVFPVLYRGESGYNVTQRVIWYATPSAEIAAFYGDLQVLENVRGLKTISFRESVRGIDAVDEEVIFFMEDKK